MWDKASKKQQQQKRRLEEFNKNKQQNAAATPSSSIYLPSVINQSLVSDNDKWLLRGKKEEINLSKLRLKAISDLQTDFASKYKEIRFLNMSHNYLSSLPDCFQLDIVKALSLQSNKLETIRVSKNMANLVELNLSSNNLTKFPDENTIAQIPSIKKLFLQKNQIKTIPAESLIALGKCSIEVLNLSFNRIEVLPLEIGLLTTLTALNLSENELIELPSTILQLKNIENSSFDVSGNKLKQPPQRIVDCNGLKSIKEHFNEATKTKASSLRMVVVGHENAGKSHLAKKLGMAIISEENVATEEPIQFREEDKKDDAHIPFTLHLSAAVRDHFLSHLPKNERIEFSPSIKVNIYDFVGQEVYHAISEMFFDKSTLHLVVFNLTQVITPHDCDVFVQYWIDLIQARAPGSSIVIVATHADRLAAEEASERVAAVQSRIRSNEKLRLNDLKREIRAADESFKPELELLQKCRPQVFPVIVAFSDCDPTTRGLKELIGQISVLASPTLSNKTPFGIININLLEHDQQVWLMLKRMRDNHQRHYCTIRELHEMMCDYKHKQTQNETLDWQVDFRSTKNAIKHWAAVGEIIWFCAGKADSKLMPPKYLPSDPCCTAGGKPSTNTTSTGAEAVNSPLVDVENAAFSEQHSGGGGGDAAEGSDDEEEGDSDDDDDSRCVFPNGFCMWDDEEACASNGDVEVHGPGDLATGSQDLDDTFQDSAGQVNLIEYVFVGPAWLNDAIKGVTDKEAMAEVERERRQLADHDHTKAALDETICCNLSNGVVFWEMIKSYLLFKSDVLKRPHGGAESLDLTLGVLREVLIYLTVIIPIENTAIAADAPEPTDLAQSAYSINDIPTSASTTDITHSTAATSTTSTTITTSALTLEDQQRSGSNKLSADYALANDLDLSGMWSNTSTQECYVLPALLAEPSHDENDTDSGTDKAICTSTQVRFAQKGSIRLERRFNFARFVPSALVPRIIAKMYSRFGALKTTTPPGNSNCNTCWRSTFIQEYGDCTVWILFEEGMGRVEPQHGVKKLSSKSLMESNEFSASVDNHIKESGVALYQQEKQVVHEEEEEDDEEEKRDAREASEDNGQMRRVQQLRIISYGHLLDVQSIVASLDDYCDAVQEILKEYKGVSSIHPTTLCPACLMRQLPEERCGQISKDNIDLLASQIRFLAAQVDVSDEDRLRDFMGLSLCSPTCKCSIKADFLVQIPEEITKLISSQAHYKALTDYIREDIINASLVEKGKEKMNRLYVDKVEKFIVNVLPVYPSIEEKAQLQRCLTDSTSSQQKGFKEFEVANGKIRSGSYVSVPAGGAAADASGQPLLKERQLVLSVFPVQNPEERATAQVYFLIGDKNHWLYLAKYITQGLPKDYRRRREDKVSEAALLELVAPIMRFPISADVTETVRFSMRSNRGVVLGREFNSSPLLLPSLVKGAPKAHLQVEQVVQICGYGAHTRAVECNWARVVQRIDEYYLVSVYSEQHLVGGPVLDNAGRIVGVVSALLYKNGNVSALYLASLNDLLTIDGVP